VELTSSTTDDAKTTGDDEEYVPPKPEVTQISEDDALFTKRCKLFFKKDGGFVDRGIGKTGGILEVRVEICRYVNVILFVTNEFENTT
jgi:hypothetical protein